MLLVTIYNLKKNIHAYSNGIEIQNIKIIKEKDYQNFTLDQ